MIAIDDFRVTGLEQTAEPVTSELERILSSPRFRRSRRLSDFLRFVVEEANAGRSHNIKEYTIGTQVYRRPESFDPVTDTIVRVEARRLRKALGEYYASAGGGGRVRIEIPKGGYEPRFLPGGETTGGSKPPSRCSIEVLAFRDYSERRDQGYFCQGIAEEISITLAQIPGVQVIASTEASPDPCAGREHPSAPVVLTGSVRTNDRMLRISAYLIDAASNRHLWSRQYDRRAGDPFRVQEAIAQSIAGELRLVANRIGAAPAREIVVGTSLHRAM